MVFFRPTRFAKKGVWDCVGGSVAYCAESTRVVADGVAVVVRLTTHLLRSGLLALALALAYTGAGSGWSTMRGSLAPHRSCGSQTYYVSVACSAPRWGRLDS